MIDGILRWSLTHRPWVLALAVGLCVWGALTARDMPLDVLPDLTAPTVTVITEGHGMAPEELEQRVTLPIESAVNGAPGVRRIRSSTAVGISIVWVELEWSADLTLARQSINERLQLVRDSLPEEVEAPIVAPTSSVMGEVLFLAMTSDRHDEMEVRTAADFVVRRRLLSIAGVSQVVPIGGEVRQLQVVLDPGALAALGVPMGEVIEAARGSNRSVSAGVRHENGVELLLHGAGRVRSPEDVATAFVAHRGGRAVLLRELADIRHGPALRRGTGSYMAAPAVVIGVQRQPGVNTLELTERLEREVAVVSAALPDGMALHTGIFRQADFIEVAVRNVGNALRDGVVLVLLVVLLFLWSPRASVVTVAAIPLSLLTAVLALELLGASLNTMTMGGMAIAIGELVDDAIVDVENVLRRLRLNASMPNDDRRPALTVVLAASQEIRGSIVYATAAVVLVFVPLFFLSGVEGRLLLPLGVAYVVALVASLLVAVTVTPVLASYLLPRAAEAVPREPSWVGALKRRYAPLLASALDHPRAVGGAALVLALGALAVTTTSGRAFLPELREGTLTVSVVTMPGIALPESDRIGRRVEEILLAQPEVVSVARRTGRAELDEHAQGVHAAEIDVSLRALDLEGARSREEMLAAMRAALGELAGVNVSIGQPISHRIDHMLSGSRAAVAVKIFGDDLTELRRLSSEIRDVMAGVDGVVDLSVEQPADVPFARIRFDRAAIASHGLSVAEVARVLVIAGSGLPVSDVVEPGSVVELVVRMNLGDDQDVDALGDVPIITSQGVVVPLRSLATVTRDRGPGEIAREGLRRKMVVTCNVVGRDVVGLVRELREAIASRVDVPDGYRVVYGGQFESADAAAQRIALLGLGAIFGILLLLASAFGSMRDACLVLINLPLALVGGVMGMVVAGNVLSVASLVGFVTLFGIATRNGIMLVSHIRHLMEQEDVVSLREAVERGAAERLVPILMTATAAAMGLLPLALAGAEPGSEIQAPMAVVILSGLVSSTLLNMLVVPALYLRWGALARGTPG